MKLRHLWWGRRDKTPLDISAAVSSVALDMKLSRRRESLLLWSLCALLVLLVLWASLAPIDKIVRAEGRIIPAGRAQVVQHLEGGIVQDILVREGERVLSGQTLMRMSDVSASSNLQQGQSRLMALKAQQSRLQAEAQGTAPQFAESLPNELRILEKKAFEERRTRMAAEQSALQQMIAQRGAELREAQARVQSLSGELQLAKQQASLIAGLLAKGAASQMELLDAQGRSERLNTQYRDVLNSLPRLLSAQAETQARLNEALSRFRAEARAELSGITAEIQRFEASVDADSDRVSRTDVRAPVAGFVNRLNFNTLGGVVKPGEVVLEITPSEGPLAVEARVRPDDRAALRAGLPTRVMVGAYDYTVYGALEGTVSEVSADTLLDEQSNRYYRIVVQTLPAKGLLAAETILPGMTASADIVVGQRSVLSYLISPLHRFKTRAMREHH
jgi:adhesin transport system membrane fusion protein